jgi:uncharacterized damage-inducible protein DinB
MDSLVEDNIVCLRQGLRLLAQLSPELYTACSDSALNSTVGAHFRHNIDHYECFLNGIATGQTDYDHRERGEAVETQPDAAIERMQQIIERIGQMSSDEIARPLDVKMDSGSEMAEPWCQSTVRRELQFLVSHTVHHYALIAVICRANGVTPEPEFGVAPSTLRYREQLKAGTKADTVACAH